MSPAGDVQLLELISDIQGLLDIDEFRTGLLDALHRAIPSDFVSLNDVGPDPASIVALVKPDVAAEKFVTFARLAQENPLVQRYLRTRDSRAYRFSDVISQDELHELALYRELYGPLGIEHQMAFTLPAGPERVLGVALSRGSPDYTDTERDLADRARPFIIQAYHNAIAYSHAAGKGRAETDATSSGLHAAGLTPREAETLVLVALGNSNQDVGARMGVSQRTVAKHLERAFKKLGVTNRSAAAARVWELAEAD